MSDELDELTKDPEPEEVEEKAQSETEDATETDDDGETGDETGEEKPDSEAPPASRESQDDRVPVAVLMEMRERAQTAERKLEELQQKAEVEKTARPDPAEDPEGAFEHLEQSVQHAQVQQWISTSRMIASALHADYAEREAVFMEMAKDNPTLVNEMLASDNPAMFAYKTAVKREEYEAVKDVDAYKAKIRAEVEADVRKQVEAETKAKGERDAGLSAAEKAAALATATDASGGTVQVPDDDSLDAVLGADAAHRK